MAAQPANSQDLLGSLLKNVSRSFYLTLRILPGSVRPQIGLAYLLARTSDTIADTGLISVDQRVKALREFRERIRLPSAAPLVFTELAEKQGSPAERVLLQNCESTLRLFRSFDSADQKRILDVIETIISGQELDLNRFAGASPQKIVALATRAELDDYTYRVAGCVGEFWTRMCRARIFSRAKLDDAALLTNGIRFGKGLQLVNILRDMPVDLRNGRCYLPLEDLTPMGLKPVDLLDPSVEPRLRPAYDRWLSAARDHLRAGWNYTTTIPRKYIRVRLACAWPVLIGLETLAKLENERILDPAHRVKIHRARVRNIILRSLVWYPFPRRWAALGPRFAPTLSGL